MPFHLEEAIAVLRRTPPVLASLLETLPDAWLTCQEAPGAYRPIDVLGHLIYGEQTDWIPRARIILELGESRPFDPFDREGFVPLIENRSAADLLAMFAELRGQNLDALESMRLGPAELALTGTHPELGRVTMEQLLATWVVHDLGHIRQIVRAMARQYRDAVGPWRAYLTILDS